MSSHDQNYDAWREATHLLKFVLFVLNENLQDWGMPSHGERDEVCKSCSWEATRYENGTMYEYKHRQKNGGTKIPPSLHSGEPLCQGHATLFVLCDKGMAC